MTAIISTKRRRWGGRCAACLLALAWLVCFCRAARAEVSAKSFFVDFAATDEALVNPFMGNVAWADDDSPHEQPFTLVYADVTWRVLEPREGAYDFEAFEANNHIAAWRAQGKKVIFRFTMDVPGKKAHRDIPDWLYAQTGDGKAYSNSYGKGYAPNYENETLIAAHARLIAALGERYGNDPMFAFVQLGSLGHWGEWHVYKGLPAIPREDVRQQYVAPYLAAFPNAQLLMRRPFAVAAREGLGLFNDMAGDKKATETWLDWIENGGEYSETGERDALLAMPEGWRVGAVGGELATALHLDKLLGDSLEQTISLLSRSHASWIGPRSFVDVARNGRDQAALDRLLCAVGYRLRVSRLTVDSLGDDAISGQITLCNDGNAPFYFDWPCALSLRRSNESARETRLALDITRVQPGEPITVSFTIPLAGLPAGDYTLCAAILDPETGAPGVRLAMDALENGLWYAMLGISLE